MEKLESMLYTIITQHHLILKLINTAIKVFAPCTNYILFSIIALNEEESDETK